MVAITHTPKLKHLDKLLAHCHRRRYTAKSTIIYAGDRCETLFFIIKGSTPTAFRHIPLPQPLPL